jgi:hypothetical protein
MTKKEEEAKQTNCYSYEVVMVVQIFAEDEDSARTKLDSEGGFVSKRSIKLKDAVPLYSGEEAQL